MRARSDPAGCKTEVDGSASRAASRGQYTPGVMLLFVLFFTATIITFGVASTTLTDATDRQLTDRAVEGMQALDSDASDVEGGAPARVTEMDLTNAQVGYGERVRMKVQASGGGVPVSWQTTTRTLAITIDETGQGSRGQTRILYAFGLIARNDRQGSQSVLVDAPSVRTSPAQTAIQAPVLTEHADSQSGVGVSGEGTVPVRLVREDARTIQRGAASGSGAALSGTITIDDLGNQRDVVGAWAQFFRQSEGFTATNLDGDGDPEYAADVDGDGREEARAQFDSDSVVVRRTTITVFLGGR